MSNLVTVIAKVIYFIKILNTQFDVRFKYLIENNIKEFVDSKCNFISEICWQDNNIENDGDIHTLDRTLMGWMSQIKTNTLNRTGTSNPLYKENKYVRKS